ncbi:MAG: urea ABC transporter substrate-binding protein [Treponema sp.]|nr:urea ABC transporter substrate-binding protein [Treponema sp.]
MKKNILFIAAVFALLFTGCKKENKVQTIKVGLLHSLTGPMAESEIPVCEAERMAIEEINASGGVLGRKIEIIQMDGESDPEKFAEAAHAMLTNEKVATIFGCWTSASRKKVKQVVENPDIFGLLWYPLQYEGLEASTNIMYMGAAPNQQVVPAVEFCYKNFGKKMFIIGSDYVFPRTAGNIINSYLSHLKGNCVGERYVSMDCKDFVHIINQIKRTKPDVILNTLNGNSNKAFFEQLKRSGITASEIPVMSFSISENEIDYIGEEFLKGHYVSWSYLQTISTAENQIFVSNYKKLYGENRVIGDPMEAGYIAVKLWAAACEKAGTFNVEDVRMAAKNLSINAPEGLVTIDGENQHLKKQVRMGRINSDSLIDEIWCSDGVVKPDPYMSTYIWAKGL